MLNFIIVLSVLFSSTSQILLKKGVMSIELQKPDTMTELISLGVSIATNVFLVLGVLFQVVALLIWLYVLKKVEVSYAYPFIALGFVFVMALSYFLFNEKLDSMKVLGGLVICLGIFLLSFSKQGLN